MLTRHKNWLRQHLFILVVGAAFLVIPPYKQYCEADYHNQYGCTGYEILAAFVSFAETYNGAITAIATGIVAWFTGTIFIMNRNQLALGRQVERAYVSGGVMIQWEETGRVVYDPISVTGGKKETVARWLYLTVDNHGKTPAFVSEVTMRICAPEELTPIPDYKGTRTANLNISPGTVGHKTQFMVDFTQAAGKLVIGRIYYTDIFRDKHSSGFIVKILGTTTSAVDAPPEYTSWD